MLILFLIFCYDWFLVLTFVDWYMINANIHTCLLFFFPFFWWVVGEGVVGTSIFPIKSGHRMFGNLHKLCDIYFPNITPPPPPPFHELMQSLGLIFHENANLQK